MNGYSPEFPLKLDSSGGAYRLTKSYTAMVQQNLKNLLLTAPGERVMDTSFGVGIRAYFFELMTTKTYERITENISKQIEKYMPFVEITNISFHGGDSLSGTDHVLGVTLSYRVIPLQTTDSLTIQNSAGPL
jgi:phage baseplate assembly protein W